MGEIFWIFVGCVFMVVFFLVLLLTAIRTRKVYILYPNIKTNTAFWIFLIIMIGSVVFFLETIYYKICNKQKLRFHNIRQDHYKKYVKLEMMNLALCFPYVHRLRIHQEYTATKAMMKVTKKSYCPDCVEKAMMKVTKKSCVEILRIFYPTRLYYTDSRYFFLFPMAMLRTVFGTSSKAFFFPTRLLIAIVTSILIGIFSGLMCLWVTGFGVDFLRNLIDNVDYLFDVSNVALQSLTNLSVIPHSIVVPLYKPNSFVPLSEMLCENQSLPVSMFNCSSYLSYFSPLNATTNISSRIDDINEKIREKVIDGMNEITRKGTDIIATFFKNKMHIINFFADAVDAVYRCYTISALLGMLNPLFLMFSMATQYRTAILSLRRGQSTFDRKKYGIQRSPEFIPLQMVHIMISTFFIWFCLGLVFTALHFFWKKISWPIVITFLLPIITPQLLKLFINCWILDKDFNRISHRYYFSVIDYVWIFLNIPGAIYFALYRLLMSMAILLIRFPKLDDSIMGFFSVYDRAYRSYVGMLVLDHTMNNPILVVFCDMVWERVQMYRNDNNMKGDKLLSHYRTKKKKVFKQRVGNYLRLCLLLIGHPYLIQYRKKLKNKYGRAIIKSRKSDTNKLNDQESKGVMLKIFSTTTTTTTTTTTATAGTYYLLTN